MNKPTIFLSHSAKDKLVINQLKDMLMKKTSQTVDVFCSSDGQSIPFGKNWVHTVEKALSDSSIMFVFVTPNSVHSNWIYFEAGFSYSKAIEVIPVGLDLDLSTIQAPLSLLQGFNVITFEGLNNILNIINIKFNYSYPLSFDSTDFALLESQVDNSVNYSSPNLEIVDHIHLRISNIKSDLGECVLLESAFEKIVNYFLKHQIACTSYNRRIETPGLSIVRGQTTPNSIFFNVKIDPLLYKTNLIFLKEILGEIYDQPMNKFYLSIKLRGGYTIISETFKISSRLQPYGIGFSTMENAFKFEDFDFVIDAPNNYRPVAELRIIYYINDLEKLNLGSLLTILLEAGVISEQVSVF